MNFVLPSLIARVFARELMHTLDKEGFLDYEGSRSIPLGPLSEENGGLMLGVLVALDEGDDVVVLKAFSGEVSGSATYPGWVPPTYDEAAYKSVLQESDATIQQLLAQGRGEEASKESRKVQQTLHRLHRFHTLHDGVRRLDELIDVTLAPSGTGDCCAPKLLSEAYRRQLRVMSMVEFYYGSAKQRTTHTFYPPCQERCSALVPAIMGLNVLYVDQDIIVVDKPTAFLSVPGIGPDKQDCVVSRVRTLIPFSIDNPSVHRLDMDTSGLLVLGLTREAQRSLSIQFQERRVSKSYIALLDGVLQEHKGVITLPFRLDTDNRPYQIHDEINGKIGVTRFERIRIEPYRNRHVTRIKFSPKTGRTHQLRVHSAHEKGLNLPIIGDHLYGRRDEGERLMLHAATLTFTHPRSGKKMHFKSPVPF